MRGTERPTNYTVGQISYDAAGRMSAQLMAKDRPTAGRGASDAERAAAAAGYVYFGATRSTPRAASSRIMSKDRSARAWSDRRCPAGTSSRRWPDVVH